MNWTLGAQRPFEIAPAVFFLENQLRPSIFRGSQRQQFLDAAYLHSIHPKPFLGGPSKYLKIQPNISSLNVKKAWSIPCMNAEYPTPILFCCCRPAYPSFPSARQGWAQPLASVRSIRRSSKIILDHLNASPLWYIIVNSYCSMAMGSSFWLREENLNLLASSNHRIARWISSEVKAFASSFKRWASASATVYTFWQSQPDIHHRIIDPKCMCCRLCCSKA